MRATFETRNDGLVALLLDAEAARAVFASVIFASRFHEELAPLAQLARRELRVDSDTPQKGKSLCQ
jgi:hypothetical protein